MRDKLKDRGVLHLTLYERLGQLFGGMHFGTAAQMKRIGG